MILVRGPTGSIIATPLIDELTMTNQRSQTDDIRERIDRYLRDSGLARVQPRSCR